MKQPIFEWNDQSLNETTKLWKEEPIFDWNASVFCQNNQISLKMKKKKNSSCRSATLFDDLITEK